MQISGAIAESVKLNSADGAPITDLNPLPTTSGGGGGGSLLADVLLTDNTGALFVGRDNGTAVTYFNLNTNAVYTPTGTIQNAGLTNTQLRATPLPVLDATSSEAQQSMVLLLTRMLNYLNAPQGYDKSLQRARQTAIIESGTVTTVTTVTTVGTVTNQANIGGIQGQILVNGGNMAAWQAAVRARIT
jgi:hypothetical protein